MISKSIETTVIKSSKEQIIFLSSCSLICFLIGNEGLFINVSNRFKYRLFWNFSYRIAHKAFHLNYHPLHQQFPILKIIR